MSVQFHDHFSGHAGDYAKFRPDYPEQLFEIIASLLPTAERKRAWDCGTGNGQAARGLAPYFERVIASDPSAQQIKQAEPHDSIEYHVWPAERSELDDDSVDLVTVAQALHWFDHDAFYKEVQRVTRPGGIIACWGYGIQGVGAGLDPILTHYYRRVVGPYWPKERAHIDANYGDIPFPFDPLPVPPMRMEREMNYHEFLGYLGTWSATRRYMKDRGEDPMDRIREDLLRGWGNPEQRRVVSWSLFMKFGRVS